MFNTTAATTNQSLNIEEIKATIRKLEEEKIFIYSNPENKAQIEKAIKQIPIVEVTYSEHIPKENIFMIKGEDLPFKY